ncbi:hypothetical protein RN001_014510 [Aquatica leii]|uniref:Uncharacterized protein n=1 Tax=Aquatica leii TaxID=1421715 RepID=A0AAN7P212_9COLE|nr:hypothetical protein RN001_014510 [Aquatica leii]
MFRCYTVFVVCLCISSISTQTPLSVDQHEIKENAGNQKNLSRVLLPFMPLAHGLRSGRITILDSRTIFIEDLHYDGKGPTAHFWVGNGSWPSDNGTIVPDENGSLEELKAYNGQNVTIKLPSNLTTNRVDYLAVWCIEYKHNFGHTYFRKKSPGGNLGVPLDPFKHGLRSGPIIAVGKKTLFVPNLYFDAEGLDAYFWVGKGSEPSPSGILVHNEKGSILPLPKYTGQSVYITLPHNVTTDSIDYFGVWSIKHKQNFGHIVIPKNAKIPPINGNPLYTSDDKEIVRVKKCCPVDQILEKTGCGPSAHKFNLTINVRERVDSYALKNLEFVPFVQPITCKHKTYPLDPKEDTFLLLTNGSLAILDPDQVYPMDEYCFETVNLNEDNKDRWVTTALLCLNSANASVSSSAFVLYAVGILLSAIFLILTALVFLFLKKTFDARDKCIVFYSSSMAVVFVCLAMAQFSQLNENTCVVIAYVIQFFLVSSFTWLTLISTESLCKILYYNSDAYTQDRNRLLIYLSVGIFLPMLIFGISLLVDQIPDIPTIVLKQQFGHNNCWFDDNETSYFYVPVAVAIFCNIILGVAMRVALKRLEKSRVRDIAWITLKDELKLMYRSAFLLLTLKSICWITEIISLILDSGESIWLAVDIVNSIQGLIVFIIFVAHPSVGKKLFRKQKSFQERYKSEKTVLRLPKDSDETVDTVVTVD